MAAHFCPDGSPVIPVFVGSSAVREKTVSADVTECPTVVDRTNWDKNAAGPLAEDEDTFDVGVEEGQVTVTHTTAESWELPLAFGCCKAPPTAQPTPMPTLQPTPKPTLKPTPKPTPSPTLEPTPEPTPKPTSEPTPKPTLTPTLEPTETPTAEPTPKPTLTEAPTAEPTPKPTLEPTPKPTPEPTAEPTAAPTQKPTGEPTAEPTGEPTPEPTPEPTLGETYYYGEFFEEEPPNPSKEPTAMPTQQPTPVPTLETTPPPTYSPGCAYEVGIYGTDDCPPGRGFAHIYDTKQCELAANNIGYQYRGMDTTLVPEHDDSLPR